MNLSSFKTILAFICVFIFSLEGYADCRTDNTYKYKNRVASYQQFWESLIPTYYFNTVFSNEFWTKEPDRYPQGYYNFSTRVRTHIYAGQRLQFHIPDSKRFFSRSITAFYEISTCDLYVVSAFTNHLNPDDYLRLSFGLKFDIF